MVIFHSYVSHYQRVVGLCWFSHSKWWFSHEFFRPQPGRVASRESHMDFFRMCTEVMVCKPDLCTTKPQNCSKTPSPNSPERTALTWTLLSTIFPDSDSISIWRCIPCFMSPMEPTWSNTSAIPRNWDDFPSWLSGLLPLHPNTELPQDLLRSYMVNPYKCI